MLTEQQRQERKKGKGNIEGMLEIKTARQTTDEWGEPGSNLIPMEYLCQVAYYCMVAELPRDYISVYFKQEEEK